MAKILIIDDERAIRNTLREILEYEDYTVEDIDNGVDGLELIQKNDYDLVLCDIKMNKMDGMEVLSEGLSIKPDLPFIMISGHGTIETAVEASKKGAFDFISKPPDLNRLLITVRNALDRGSLVTETKVLKRKVSKTREILGESQAIGKIKETIDRVAPTDAAHIKLRNNLRLRPLIICIKRPIVLLFNKTYRHPRVPAPIFFLVMSLSNT